MDRYQQKLSAYTDVSNQLQIGTADTGTKKIIAAITGYVIYVQRILVDVLVDAAQNLTFQDSNGTPVKIAVTKVSPGLGPITFDFGPDGYPLTESTELDAVISGAGTAYAIQVQAYAKRVGVANILVGNTVGGGTPGTLGSKDP